MANIATHLANIMSAIFGEEVRTSIHDAISAINDESSDAKKAATEAQDSAANSAKAAKESETNAGKSADNSENFAKLSKSYANGKTGTRDGEDYDNSKYYSEKSKENADKAKESQTAAESAKKSAEKSAKDAEINSEKAGKPPIIQNGTWWIWNTEQREYVDTGEPVRGNLMYAVFWIDERSGDLYMITDDEYEGPYFRLNDSDLEVVFNAGNVA